MHHVFRRLHTLTEQNKGVSLPNSPEIEKSEMETIEYRAHVLKGKFKPVSAESFPHMSMG
ncbi:hypothetical protein K491DRAFT_694836 [Lophiostoma macrostomum CBS 122681]|uniref:Uncharacterized protein n=1 Tax=Lophiostoma macrostomum CBS 122681 TaxID=1314788 RepID=A0A6A6T040_9PLEO|nr:hypothetical protein K491DRAFT_694836 [Lophiostoma macrostomum CBS 122681]